MIDTATSVMYPNTVTMPTSGGYSTQTTSFPTTGQWYTTSPVVHLGPNVVFSPETKIGKYTIAEIEEIIDKLRILVI